MKRAKATKTSISFNDSRAGETIEEKMRRIVHNNEPIKDSAPIIFTERKLGIIGDYNIRNDRWDNMLDSMSMVATKQKRNRLSRQEARAAKKNAEAEGTGSTATEEGKA